MNEYQVGGGMLVAKLLLPFRTLYTSSPDFNIGFESENFSFFFIFLIFRIFSPKGKNGKNKNFPDFAQTAFACSP